MGLAMLMAFTSCSDSQNELIDGNNELPVINGPSKPNTVIDEKLFEVINLNHSGLEEVKSHYEAGNYYWAAEALLKYYRNRTGITNPALSLINVSVSDNEKRIADYALTDYRFYVKNFYEDAATEKPYSIKKENVIDWTFEPQGASDEYQKQLHRHQWFIPQAKAYRVTNDEKYIKSWIEIYGDWLKQNPQPENGVNTTTWWQLQVATRVNDQVQLFEYYKNSINFTPEWLSTFLVAFAQEATFLNQYPYPSEGNILITQESALATAGILFPEFKEASEWQNKGLEALSQQVKKQFLDDGMHCELDLSYHIAAIGDYYEILKLVEANGMADQLPTDLKESLYKATQVVKNMTFPSYFTGNGTYFVPGFNDTRQDSWKRSVLNKNFKRYAEMFPNDQEALYLATYGKQGKQPNNNPAIFSEGGYYILRNGWDYASTMMVLSNNYAEVAPSVWTHNQADNGTFELYHNGRNFFPDSGVYTYYTSGSSNTDRRWFRQSQVHNTLTINGQDYINTQGKHLNATFVGDAPTEVIATENKGYASLKHRRTVFFVDNKFFVLVDEAIDLTDGSLITGLVNLNFNLCEGSDSEIVIDNTDNGAHTAFSDGNNMVIRSFGNGNTSVLASTGKISYKPGELNTRKRYAINMNKVAGDKACRYITVIYPTSNWTKETISATFPSDGTSYDAGRVAADVSINGKIYHLKCNIVNN